MTDYAEMNARAALRAEISALEAKLAAATRERSGAEMQELAAAQHRADCVLAPHGRGAPSPGVGQTPLDYRRSLACQLAQFSPRYKNEPLTGLGPVALAASETQIYGDAEQSAKEAHRATPGRLFPHTKRDESGRLITEFHGDPPHGWRRSRILARPLSLTEIRKSMILRRSRPPAAVERMLTEYSLGAGGGSHPVLRSLRTAEARLSAAAHSHGSRGPRAAAPVNDNPPVLHLGVPEGNSRVRWLCLMNRRTLLPAIIIGGNCRTSPYRSFRVASLPPRSRAVSLG